MPIHWLESAWREGRWNQRGEKGAGISVEQRATLPDENENDTELSRLMSHWFRLAFSHSSGCVSNGPKLHLDSGCLLRRFKRLDIYKWPRLGPGVLMSEAQESTATGGMRPYDMISHGSSAQHCKGRTVTLADRPDVSYSYEVLEAWRIRPASFVSTLKATFLEALPQIGALASLACVLDVDVQSMVDRQRSVARGYSSASASSSTAPSQSLNSITGPSLKLVKVSNSWSSPDR